MKSLLIVIASVIACTAILFFVMQKNFVIDRPVITHELVIGNDGKPTLADNSFVEIKDQKEPVGRLLRRAAQELKCDLHLPRGHNPFLDSVITFDRTYPSLKDILEAVRKKYGNCWVIIDRNTIVISDLYK